MAARKLTTRKTTVLPFGHPKVVARAKAEDRQSDKRFDAIHRRLLDQISALYCALKTIEGTDWEQNEELSAAVALLGNAHEALNGIYDELGREARP